MKLARKIMLLMVATFVCVLAVLGWIESRRAIDEYRARVASELVLTGRALRAPLGEVLEVEGESRALKLVEKADNDITRMNIRWVQLSRLTEDERNVLVANKDIIVERDTLDGPTVFVYVPVGVHGAIELTQNLSEERTVVLGVVRERLLVAFVAILVAGILSVFAGVRIVGEPMNALAEHARTIGSGELDRRLDLETKDEIGELAREMNRMAERLRESRAQADALAVAKIKAMDQLRHADRLTTIGTLASGMAHELGTPLGVIGGRAKMIAADGVTREETVQYAHVISGQVERMTKIMRGLLDFARRTPAKKSRTNVREIAARIVDLLTPLAKRQGAVLKVLDGEATFFADADGTQLEQALANLVVNGAQSMPNGGDLTIEVAARRATAPGATEERDWICVSVRDRGKGIAKDDLPHVFEPFFTTKEVGAGTGLGLSVTYGIVEDHGGFIDVESELGRGTCFHLYLPVAT